MGTPEARVFLEPQKIAVIRSSSENPHQRDTLDETKSAAARKTAAPARVRAMTPRPLSRHSPEAVESQNEL